MSNCEPLIGKKIEEYYWLEEEEKTVFLFSDVASAIKFYKRYRVSTKDIKLHYQQGGLYNVKLWEDYPKLVDKYFDQDEGYNEWLFDYCFGDVIE